MAAHPTFAHASCFARLGAVAALIVGTFAADANAQSNMANAENLFRRAKALMASQKYVEACPLLEESYRLEKAMGTLLNLALCHEQVGKVASAWGEFRAVEQQAMAAQPPREDRAQLARDHAKQLHPRVSWLRLVAPSVAERPAGLVVKVDGQEQGEPLWSTGIAVDAGTRVVEAAAPGKKSWTGRVRIDDEGTTQTVTIPRLADVDVPRAAPPQATTDLEQLEALATQRARRTTGFVVGGLGLATLLVGGTFGVLAITNNNEATSDCASPCYTNNGGAQLSDQATNRALVFANVANVTLPLGAILGATGAYLVLTANKSKPSPGPRAHALVGPSGLVVGGSL